MRLLPALGGGRLVGMLSDRDVALVESLGRSERWKVSEVMSSEAFAVGCDEALKDVVAQLARRKLGSAVVVEGTTVVGIFTTTDALHLLLQHLTLDGVRGL